MLEPEGTPELLGDQQGCGKGRVLHGKVGVEGMLGAQFLIGLGVEGQTQCSADLAGN